jgi:hypothetical protein
MRTIIAGSRNITDYVTILHAISLSWKPTVVISGCARGADKLGEEWAIRNNVPIERFPANWNEYGKSAGYRRNVEMSENAEALLAIWDGESKGTKHMIDIAKKKELLVYIYLI